MEKLKLDLNTLKVESFEINRENDLKGTVNGNASQAARTCVGVQGCTCTCGDPNKTVGLVCESIVNCTTDNQLLCDIRTKAHLSCELTFCDARC